MHRCNEAGSYRNRFHLAVRITGMIPPLAPVTRDPLGRMVRKMSTGVTLHAGQSRREAYRGKDEMRF